MSTLRWATFLSIWIIYSILTSSAKVLVFCLIKIDWIFAWSKEASELWWSSGGPFQPSLNRFLFICTIISEQKFCAVVRDHKWTYNRKEQEYGMESGPRRVIKHEEWTCKTNIMTHIMSLSDSRFFAIAVSHLRFTCDGKEAPSGHWTTQVIHE